MSDPTLPDIVRILNLTPGEFGSAVHGLDRAMRKANGVQRALLFTKKMKLIARANNRQREAYAQSSSRQ